MKRALAGMAAVALFGAGIGVGYFVDRDTGDQVDSGPSALPTDDIELVSALSSFDACDDYLAHVRERALEQVTPYGLGGGWFGPVAEGGDDALESDQAAADSDGGAVAGAAPSAGTTPDDVSGTNVQEQGVDEPDRVKTDGEVAFTTIGGALRVLDVTGDTPRELSRLELGEAWGAELLLAGDRLLVTTPGGMIVPFAGESLSRDAIGPVHGATTTLTAIDVSDPADPVVEQRVTLDGATLSARMVEGIARVVVRTEPGINLPWAQPEAEGLRAERDALEQNRRLIADSEAEDWLPYYVHETADGEQREGLLLDCEQVARPSQFAGLGTLSVLTIDVDGGDLVPDEGGVGVMAGGDTVYASTDRLYVATQRFVDPAVLEDAARTEDRPDELDRMSTQVHTFDIGDPAGTTYLASGEVPGVLLDQWALSEHEGILRVASTIGDRWWGGGEDSSSLVTTLERDGDELETVGQVGDLGPTERIFAVRFIGDVGYVVTFRQTDPLYVLDLSDPTEPTVTGELKIPGYSAYLHPVGDGLLVGVGQDAQEDTGQPLGTQVSLFDVGDPTEPRRLDTLTVEDSASDVEHDHRGFLHWPATGLTVVPVTRWWLGEGELPAGPPNGALAFTATAEGFAAAGQGAANELVLSHAEEVADPPTAAGDPAEPDAAAIDAWHGQHHAAIQRSMVVGSRVFTFSERGVMTHRIDGLAALGSLGY